MTSHGTRSRRKSRDFRVSASDVTHPSPGSLLPFPGNSDACTIEGFVRGTGMSKKSVLRSSTSKFSVGDNYGNLVCEEGATCELKVLFEVCYEDCEGI
jgi:hypothetical protein